MPKPKSYHNFRICRFCGAEYDDGYPGSEKAGDGEHLCDVRVLDRRIVDGDYTSYAERDDLKRHAEALKP